MAAEILEFVRGVILLTAAAMASSVSALAACKMAKMAELPVTMVGLAPLIDAKINDKDVRFVVDSGAFYSMISTASAAELNLKLGPAPYGMSIVGIAGGRVKPSVTNVETLILAGIPVHNMGFFVSGSVGGLAGGSVGLLGQNVFGVSDVEYDFANGKIRFIKSDDCQRAMLAYWVAGGQAYSVMDIDPISNYHTHITSHVYLDGAKLAVTFDTGSNVSLLSLRAASRAGIDPKSDGIIDGGFVGGVGNGAIKSYVGVFPSFKVGDEEVQHATLRFGGSLGVDTDMLIGADFFLSHRVYLATNQRKLYFTYNGGPVFNLKQMAVTGPAAEASQSEGATAPADEHLPVATEDGAKLSAADYAVRGAASAARRDFEHAISDLTRACEMSPDNAEFLYQRGIVYLHGGKPKIAAEDFDRALELKPEHISALINRAELRIKAMDFQGARMDLDAADRAATQQADLRFYLAQDYIQADLPAKAVAQFDVWMISHKQDSKRRLALSRRCWARALQNESLDEALSNCNDAMYALYEKSPGYSDVLGYRGLVRYRMGRYDKSIADYNDALKLDPKAALSLYSRGLAKIRAKKPAEGEADISQALKMEPGVANQFNRLGITP
jgi:tetratricopeptide (TPR) repeat protein/predicted aspartyl protease